MSALFNQTNLTPGTTFASGGGQTSITLGGISVIGGAAGTSLVIQPANEIFLGNGSGGTAFYGLSTISYNTGAGKYDFLTAGVSTIALANLSSIQAGAFTVNAVALMSTVKGNNWG